MRSLRQHARRLSTLKAGPSVQRLIRRHGLDSARLVGTGPKGTVSPADVDAAVAAQAEADAHSLEPVEIELPAMTAHMFDASSLPTRATTNKKELFEYYEKMFTMRRMEIAADVLYKAKLVKGFCHLYDGQEAVGMGIEAASSYKDSVVTSYRDHTWQFTRGDSVTNVLGELLGKYNGSAKGKGGSMHMYRKEANFFGGNGIVGAQTPIGAGLGFAHKYRDDGGVSFALYGDGAANQGQLFEAVNLSALMQLPVIFVCENNQYGMGTSTNRGSFDTDYYARGQYIPGLKVDGMNILAVREAVRYAMEHARSSGPVMMEMDTYRYHGHSMSDPGITYRSRDEVSGVRSARDPVQLVKSWLIDLAGSSADEVKAVERRVRQTVERAVEAAKAAPQPPAEELTRDIYFSQGDLKPRMCNSDD